MRPIAKYNREIPDISILKSTDYIISNNSPQRLKYIYIFKNVKYNYNKPDRNKQMNNPFFSPNKKSYILTTVDLASLPNCLCTI